MTSPFNPVIPAGHVPPVAPIYFAQGPNSNELLQHSFDQLMRTLQAKDQMALENAKFQFAQSQAAQQQATTEGAGKILQNFLPALQRVGGPPALPAMTLPGVVGQVPSTPPFRVENAMNLAFRGRPGTQVIEATKAANSEILEAMKREAKPNTAAPKLELQADDQGWGKIVDLYSGKAHQVYNDDGSKFRMKDPRVEAGKQTPGTDNMNMVVMDPSDPMYGKVVRKPISPGASFDPNKAFPVELIKQGNYDAAKYYPAMVQAYKNVRNAWIDPADASQFAPTGTFWTKLASLAETSPDKTATMAIFGNLSLKPATRAWLSGLLAIENSLAYAESGKVITVGELYRRMAAEVPTPLDEPAVREPKWQQLEAKLTGMAHQAAPALVLQGLPTTSFEPVMQGMQVRRGAQEAIAALNRAVQQEHPGWPAAKVANEALRRYRAQQPALSVP